MAGRRAGINCTNGGTAHSGSNCRDDRSRNFSGEVTPELMRFEARILRRVFNTTVAQWEQSNRYHAYHLANVIAGRSASMSTVWRAYATRPAPTHQRRSAPVRTGDRTLVNALVRPGRSRFSVPVPLPGGYVTHHVDTSLRALINTTVAEVGGRIPRRIDIPFTDRHIPLPGGGRRVGVQGHVLHPGHIMRWLVRNSSGEIESHTLGRGIGAMPATNEVWGLEIFDDLDMSIRSSL